MTKTDPNKMTEVLYDLDPVKKPIAFASISLSRALRSKGEQRMKLQPLEGAKGSWPKARPRKFRSMAKS